MEILGITVLYPDAALVVMAVAIGVSLFSATLHRKMVDRKKMDEIRKRIESHQKEYLAAQKSDDKKRLKQLEREQREVMGLLKKNFMMSMKPLIITMPIFLVILWWMRGQFDKFDALLELPFSIPFFTYAVENTAIVNGVSWFGIYLVSAIGTSLVVELVLRKILHK